MAIKKYFYIFFYKFFYFKRNSFPESPGIKVEKNVTRITLPEKIDKNVLIKQIEKILDTNKLMFMRRNDIFIVEKFNKNRLQDTYGNVTDQESATSNKSLTSMKMMIEVQKISKNYPKLLNLKKKRISGDSWSYKNTCKLIFDGLDEFVAHSNNLKMNI